MLLGLTLGELAGFGMGLNPAIAAANSAPRAAPDRATSVASSSPVERVLGIGQELPPNTLMRLGLGDPRNYDSVELREACAGSPPVRAGNREPLESQPDHLGQRATGLRDRLEASGVRAVVGAISRRRPARLPGSSNVGDVWIAWLSPRAGPATGRGHAGDDSTRDPGRAVLCTLAAGRRSGCDPGNAGMPGWTARIDGRPRSRSSTYQRYIYVGFGSGGRPHVLELAYRPVEVVYGLMGVWSGNGCRDTRLDRTGWFLDSWNNQERAWTEPSPEVRIEPVNFTGHFRPAQQI